MAGLRGPERREPGQPGVFPASSGAGEVKLVTPGNCVLPGVSEGAPKAFSNGFGSLLKCAVWICPPPDCAKYSPPSLLSPPWLGLGGGARGALVVGPDVSFEPSIGLLSSG